jgi:hypothetical protein
MLENTWASLFWIVTQVFTDILVSAFTAPFILPGIVIYYFSYFFYFIMVNSAGAYWNSSI